METEEIREKKEPKRLPVWACILLFALGLFVCMGLYGTIGFGLLSLILGDEARHPGLLVYTVTEANMLLSVLTPAVILLYFERRPFSDLGLTLKGHVRGLWYGLLVALTEEIMMRGYILGRLLHTRMNKFLALFVSALLFALLHIFNPNVAFLPMLNLVIAGMLIGASYLYTRNLCFPISLHLFWNWIQGPILGYQVSGNDLGTSLLTLHLPEENVLNGGAFGFEGSLICTVLMIIFTILIVWWGEKREAISLAVPRSC